jgi:hypothetical protein
MALSLAINLVRPGGRLQWRWWWKQWRRWYVQNVSTFPNTFAIVSPLICVFWIQLTRTNAIFSRIALVSCFCAEIQLSVKIQEKSSKILFHQKTHGAKRRDGVEARGLHTHTGGAAQPWSRPPGVRPARPSTQPLLLPTYTPWPKNIGEMAFFPDRLLLRHRH